MEAYAVLETGGKQVLVKAGDTIEIEKLSVNENEEGVLDEYLVFAFIESVPKYKPIEEEDYWQKESICQRVKYHCECKDR